MQKKDVILLKIITIVSNHPGSGQTTITINLASGLARQGFQVLIANMGNNEKLYNWLGIISEYKMEANSKDNNSSPILASRMGIDLLKMTVKLDISSDTKFLSADLEGLNYDYLLLLPESQTDCCLLNQLSDYLIACTDLSHPNEVADLISLEKKLHESEGAANRISLLVLNKINTKEWEHNSQQLFALAEYFGYERIADPIPRCERIHDLPLTGQTAWELNQQNLQIAFMGLVEAVRLL